VFWPQPTNRAPFFSARRYSRSTAEDASAESKSPDEAPIYLAPIKTEHSESSHHISTSICVDGHGWLNSLNNVAKPSTHESNPDRLDPCLYSHEAVHSFIHSWVVPAGGIKNTCATLLARIINMSCFDQFTPRYSTVIWALR